jgi:hypothetical protein
MTKYVWYSLIDHRAEKNERERNGKEEGGTKKSKRNENKTKHAA